MGRRILISEEEKKTILSLYESAPPPDESVLVANKNPFKYSEYESARREYSKDLVDGDLFYNIKDSSKLFQELYNLIENDLNYIYGKTFKYNDKIYRFKKTDIHYMFNQFSDYSNGGLITLSVDCEQDSKHYKVIYSFTYKKIDRYSAPMSDDTKEKLSNYFEKMRSKLSFSNLSDDNFEIRKIVRKKTDF